MGSPPEAAGLEDLQPEKIVTVLSVSGSESDHQSLAHVFRHTKWRLLESNSCADAVSLLQRGRVPVVICERLLPDGNWRDLLNGIAALPVPPLLIVAARLADDRLWSDVMNGGGYDVLEKPFNHSELVRVVSLAWLAWKDQFQRAGAWGSNVAGD
jgi:DNA-binding response OmpR family regulator